MAKIIYDNQGNFKDLSDEGREVNRRELKELVRQLLNKLTPRQREIMILRLDGYKAKEIARELGIKEETVWWHIKEATKYLRNNPPI